jgi:hypothetical protein
VVVGVYILFLAVGVYSGQTTMSVDIIGPPDGTQFHYSPVQLVARVTVRGVPVSNAKARFTIASSTIGESSTDTDIDKEGIARQLVPASSGNYTWRVAAVKDGYPTIVSRSGSFSIMLSLVVDGIQPSSSVLAVSPVGFKVKVSDSKGQPVESANVTFYLDFEEVGSNLTNQNGIARLTAAALSGRHIWFASATKQGEGGISDPIQFIVGQLASLAKGDFAAFESSSQVCWNTIAAISRAEQELACRLPH